MTRHRFVIGLMAIAIVISSCAEDAPSGPSDRPTLDCENYVRRMVAINGDVANVTRASSAAIDGLRAGSIDSETGCSPAGAVMVDAGTYEIHFVTAWTDVDGAGDAITLFGSTMWVQWVPFDGAGEVPTEFTDLDRSGASMKEGFADLSGLTQQLRGS